MLKGPLCLTILYLYRYMEALRAQIQEKMRLYNITLPPLCCCGPDFWDAHPDTCANNCIFYKNHRGELLKGMVVAWWQLKNKQTRNVVITVSQHLLRLISETIITPLQNSSGTIKIIIVSYNPFEIGYLLVSINAGEIFLLHCRETWLPGSPINEEIRAYVLWPSVQLHSLLLRYFTVTYRFITISIHIRLPSSAR